MFDVPSDQVGKHHPVLQVLETLGEVNILIGEGVLETDKDLFFGPVDTRSGFLRFPNSSTWEDLSVTLGFFPSKGQARKNGWGGLVPPGFTDRRFGKKRVRVTVLKILSPPSPSPSFLDETSTL